jgi:hypothetical protein
MLADVAESAVGIAGTVLYLLVWNSVRRRMHRPEDDEATQRRRQRLVQTLFFVLLTPWVLALFWCMERAGAWLRSAGW